AVDRARCELERVVAEMLRRDVRDRREMDVARHECRWRRDAGEARQEVGKLRRLVVLHALAQELRAEILPAVHDPCRPGIVSDPVEQPVHLLRAPLPAALCTDWVTEAAVVHEEEALAKTLEP